MVSIGGRLHTSVLSKAVTGQSKRNLPPSHHTVGLISIVRCRSLSSPSSTVTKKMRIATIFFATLRVAYGCKLRFAMQPHPFQVLLHRHGFACRVRQSNVLKERQVLYTYAFNRRTVVTQYLEMAFFTFRSSLDICQKVSRRNAVTQQLAADVLFCGDSNTVTISDDFSLKPFPFCTMRFNVQLQGTLSQTSNFPSC